MARKDERSGHRRSREKDLASPVSVWKEKDSIDGKMVDAGVVILRTRGCSHFHAGGCSMCGYNAESSDRVSQSDLESQFAKALEKLSGVHIIKVYTSGSFLDRTEVSEQVAGKIVETCSDLGARLLVESRPEYITEESIDSLLGFYDDLEVAVGLESANDNILKYSINKGFTLKDYDRAAQILHGKGVALRTYLLLKPPFLIEAEAIEDTVAAARHASRYSQVISVNPVNVQKGTLVEKLWKSWSFRPPWLWSVLEVVRECSSLESRTVCDPVGGGSSRGAHNCGRCDSETLEGLREFSITQDPKRLIEPECECKRMWKTLVETEPLVLGGTCDLQRFFARS